MPHRPLDPARLAVLRGAPYSYPEVGGLERAPLPVGYRPLRETAVLPVGLDPQGCREVLLAWGLQTGAGVRVTASGPVTVGAVADLRIGWGPLSVRAPVRVVHVVDTEDRVGFSYGSLPGHPERGEESFVAQRRTDGRTELVIRAFSREARWYSRVGAPVTRLVQAWMIRRYLAVLSGRRT